MATRLERVVLDLEDKFSREMAQAAAATALLNRELNSLSGRAVQTSRVTRDVDSSISSVGTSSRTAGADIDRFSGRLRLFADVAVMLGPALIPIGAVAIPAVTGLAAALGFAAVGAGVAVVAFQGVGDALKAANKAAIEPTTENLQAAREAMQAISPAARDFVRELRDMGPAFKAVRDSAAAGLFPGLVEALNNIEPVLPKVADVFERIGVAVGDLAADGAGALAGPQWAEFIAFIGAEAPRALEELGRTLGDISHGLAELWMAFTPLNSDFGSWMRDVARSFDQWASGLSETQGFEDFIDYIRTNGPKVADAMGSIGNAFLQITQAVAPLGGPVLEIIAGLADALGAIADSGLGTPLFTTVAALTALNRASQLLGKASLGVDNFAGSLKRLGTAALALAVLEGAGRAIDALRDKASGAAPDVAALTNALRDASDAEFGKTFGGDIQDALNVMEAGGWSGFVQDLNAIGDSSNIAGGALHALGATVLPGLGNQMSAQGIQTEKAAKAFKSLDAALLDIAGTGGIGAARQAFTDLADSQNLTFDQQQKLLGVLPGYADALAAAGKGATVASEGLKGLLSGSGVGGIRETTDALNGAADAAISLSDALAGLAGWLDKREAFRGFGDAMRELTKSMDQGKVGQWAENIDAVGRSIIQVFEAMKASGAPRAARFAFLDNAISGLQKVAKDAGPKARGQVEALIGQLRKVGDVKVEPKVDLNDKPLRNKEQHARGLLKGLGGIETNPIVDLDDDRFLSEMGLTKGKLRDLDNDAAKPTVSVNDQASGTLAHIQSLIAGIRDKSVTITTTHRTNNYTGDGRNTSGGVTSADGGYIRGPGTTTSDSIPALLSDREYVIKAAAVDHYGVDFFDRANSMMLAAGGLVANTHAQRFANGGQARPDFGIGTAISLRAVGNTADGAARALKGFEKELAAAEKQRQRLRSRAETIRSGVGGMLDDPFATIEGDVWRSTTAGGIDPLAALRGDNRELRAYRRELAELRKRGLSGAAFEAAAASGNLDGLQALGDYSKRELREYTQLFQQRQRLSGRVGNQAVAQAGITRGLDRVQKEIRELRKDIKREEHQNREHGKKNTREFAGAIKGEVNRGQRNRR